MRVLLTGATGFVGRALFVALGSAHAVVPAARSVDSARGLRLDLADPDACDAALSDLVPCEVIVHAAAHIAMTPFDPAVVRVNALGAQTVARWAETWGAYVVYLSSIQVIGTPHHHPITEDHPTHPRTTYHAAKLFGEHVVLNTARACALRLTAPVGVDMPANRILPVFARRAAAGEPLTIAGEGGRRQDYVHVDDIADAVARCIAQKPTGVFNLGSGISISNRELAERCIALTGSRSHVTYSGQPDPEEANHWDVSIDKARAAFGYAPHGDLDALIQTLASH
ncbi:MAG: NAD(P)-dependent oxidoreductase [Chloroflexi bacterium]|nr:NAD(P)-dependent oxidoreductase [Chloroflexota bacterium]